MCRSAERSVPASVPGSQDMQRSRAATSCGSGGRRRGCSVRPGSHRVRMIFRGKTAWWASLNVAVIGDPLVGVQSGEAFDAFRRLGSPVTHGPRGCGHKSGPRAENCSDDAHKPDRMGPNGIPRSFPLRSDAGTSTQQTQAWIRIVRRMTHSSEARLASRLSARSAASMFRSTQPSHIHRPATAPS